MDNVYDILCYFLSLTAPGYYIHLYYIKKSTRNILHFESFVIHTRNKVEQVYNNINE